MSAVVMIGDQDCFSSNHITPKLACLSIGGANQPASLNISIFSGCSKIFHAHLQGLTSV
ncbi:MAG: hypothetical protein IPP67_04300 [Rhodospirillaceae bacterium]|nr:hypothetical protein [Rhodospirillaceae bacterium]